MFCEFKKTAQNFLAIATGCNRILKIESLLEIAKGGCHRVYLSSYSLDFVIKVSHRMSELIQDEAYQFSTKALNRYITHENSKYYQLYKYFGYDQCILQSTEKVSIQIRHDDSILALLGAVVVQKYEKSLREKPRVELTTRYLDLEWSIDLNVEDYDLINQCLLSDKKFVESTYLNLNSRAFDCFWLIEKDLFFKEKILFFINSFLSYLTNTKVLMDLVGENNVILVNTHNQWSIRVGSVVKDTSWQSFEEALVCLNNQPLYIVENAYFRNALLNGLAVCRLINALSLKLQGCRAISVTLNAQQLKNLVYLREIYEKAEARGDRFGCEGAIGFLGKGAIMA